eukprot:403341066
MSNTTQLYIIKNSTPHQQLPLIQNSVNNSNNQKNVQNLGNSLSRNTFYNKSQNKLKKQQDQQVFNNTTLYQNTHGNNVNAVGGGGLLSTQFKQQNSFDNSSLNSDLSNVAVPQLPRTVNLNQSLHANLLTQHSPLLVHTQFSKLTKNRQIFKKTIRINDLQQVTKYQLQRQSSESQQSNRNYSRDSNRLRNHTVSMNKLRTQATGSTQVDDKNIGSLNNTTIIKNIQQTRLGGDLRNLPRFSYQQSVDTSPRKDVKVLKNVKNTLIRADKVFKNHPMPSTGINSTSIYSGITSTPQIKIIDSNYDDQDGASTPIMYSKTPDMTKNMKILNSTLENENLSDIRDSYQRVQQLRTKEKQGNQLKLKYRYLLKRNLQNNNQNYQNLNNTYSHKTMRLEKSRDQIENSSNSYNETQMLTKVNSYNFTQRNGNKQTVLINRAYQEEQIDFEQDNNYNLNSTQRLTGTYGSRSVNSRNQTQSKTSRVNLNKSQIAQMFCTDDNTPISNSGGILDQNKYQFLIENSFLQDQLDTSSYKIEDIPFKLSDKQVKSMTKFHRLKQVIGADYSKECGNTKLKFDPNQINDRIKFKAEQDNFLTQEKVKSILKQSTLKKENPDILKNQSQKAHEIIQQELNKLQQEKCAQKQLQSEKSRIKWHKDKNKTLAKNTYLNLNDDKFRERINQNKLYFKVKMGQIRQADKIYNQLINNN